MVRAGGSLDGGGEVFGYPVGGFQTDDGSRDPDIRPFASGTLANILAISSVLRPHEAVIAPASGHIVVRETGAIEATGHKIITVPPVQGKLTPESISAALAAERSLSAHGQAQVGLLGSTSMTTAFWSQATRVTLRISSRTHRESTCSSTRSQAQQRAP